MRNVVLVLLGCVLLGVGIGAYSEPSGDASKLSSAQRPKTVAARISHSASRSSISRSARAAAVPSIDPSVASVYSDSAVPLVSFSNHARSNANLVVPTDAAKVAALQLSPATPLNGLMPTSGSEPQYSPRDWNNPFIGPGNNCYAYACDDASDLRMSDCDFPQPGSTAGELPCDRSDFTVDLVRRRAIADGLAPVPQGREEGAPPDGFYKVALFIDPGKDYHWYRQDDDGSWSHKLGDGPVLNVDGDGRPITDPRTASQNYENHTDPLTGRPIGGYNYTQFGGFFYVPEGGIRLRSGHG
jgi:hypothetical protein